MSHENGLKRGSRVELSHGPNSYWVADVKGDFGLLLSLQWFSKGKPSRDFFHDLSDPKTPVFYPLGYYDSHSDIFPNMTREPPASVTDTTVSEEEYADMIKEFSDDTPLCVFENKGLSLDILKTDSILEVSCKDDPFKHWFARVIKNVGGRLLLEWILSQETQQSHFWLFYCHPRIQSNAFVDDDGISYEPPVLFNGWQEKLTRLREDLSKVSPQEELKNLMIKRAQESRPLIYPESLEMDEGSKTLIFPSNVLKLLSATVERKVSERKWFKIRADSNEQVCHSFWIPHSDCDCILSSSWTDDNEISVESTSLSTCPAVSFKVKFGERITEFKSNGRIEVVHPDDPDMICEAIIIRVTPPLVWVQVSLERIHVLPFNSTEMFPSGWSENNGYPLTKLLPKTASTESKTEKKPHEEEPLSTLPPEFGCSGGKGWCPRIYFNYKCFTGPSLSKSKLCNLPRFVGPGPVLLVMKEVISKILSIAYVSSRILNDLASDTFADLLSEHDILKVEHVQFKAKYNNSQKTARLDIPIIRSSEKIEEFCHLLCSHLKCCFNLLGPKLYDGDTCPSKCRGLTKSNKILKRPDFFRQQAITASQYLKGEIEVATFENIKMDISTKGVGRGRGRGIKRPVEVRVPGVPSNTSNSGSDHESNKKPKNDDKVLDEGVYDDVDETTRSSSLEGNPSAETSSSQPKKEYKRTNGSRKKSGHHEKLHSDPLSWDIMKVYKFLLNSKSAVFASHFRDHVSYLEFMFTLMSLTNSCHVTGGRWPSSSTTRPRNHCLQLLDWVYSQVLK